MKYIKNEDFFFINYNIKKNTINIYYTFKIINLT